MTLNKLIKQLLELKSQNMGRSQVWIDTESINTWNGPVVSKVSWKGINRTRSNGAYYCQYVTLLKGTK